MGNTISCPDIPNSLQTLLGKTIHLPLCGPLRSLRSLRLCVRSYAKFALNVQSMQSIIETLHNLARQQGMSDKKPLIALHTLESQTGTPISHLPMEQQLVQAWVRMTGSPFCQHQSLALAALRRSEPVALVGNASVARQTLHLFLYELLGTNPQECALLLLPDEETVAIHLTHLDELNTELGKPLQIAAVDMSKIPREATTADVLLTTPEALHKRLLRHYDRAWRKLWNHPALLMLFDLDQYTGVAAAHLASLLMRISRIVAYPPLLTATLANVQDSPTSLQELIGEPWRMLPVNDIPRSEKVLAFWQAGPTRLTTSASLAGKLQRAGYRVHIICERLEVPLLLAQMGPDVRDITAGPVPYEAQVHLFAGYPRSSALIQQSLESSFADNPLLTLLVLGDSPIEQLLLRKSQGQPEGQDWQSLFPDFAPPVWLPPPTNAYVSSRHLLCAASERVLKASETESWEATEMVAHMERRKQLVRLPGAEETWQPARTMGDPYENFALRTAGSAAIAMHNEQNILIDWLDPALFDRWGFRGASLPPGANSYRVVEHVEEEGVLDVRTEPETRRTFPLRSCEVAPREERDQRMVRETHLTYGRVVCDEEIYGYREVRGQHKAIDQRLAPTLTARWTAPALWFELPITLKDEGQLVGWSLTWALPLCVLAHHTDLVPCYDRDKHLLYLIEAQPGGNGIAHWLYAHLETLLPLAYDIALNCRHDLLLEPMARSDMDWLLTFLGGVPVPEEEEAQPIASRSTAPAASKPGAVPWKRGTASPAHFPSIPGEQRPADEERDKGSAETSKTQRQRNADTDARQQQPTSTRPPAARSFFDIVPPDEDEEEEPSPSAPPARPPQPAEPAEPAEPDLPPHSTSPAARSSASRAADASGPEPTADEELPATSRGKPASRSSNSKSAASEEQPANRATKPVSRSKKPAMPADDEDEPPTTGSKKSSAAASSSRSKKRAAQGETRKKAPSSKKTLPASQPTRPTCPEATRTEASATGIATTSRRNTTCAAPPAKRLNPCRMLTPSWKSSSNCARKRACPHSPMNRAPCAVHPPRSSTCQSASHTSRHTSAPATTSSANPTAPASCAPAALSTGRRYWTWNSPSTAAWI